MQHRRRLLLGGCAVAGLLGTASIAAETITYSYDALGRLRTSSVSGGVSNGTNTAICYDPVSNRERYTTTVAGAASCATSAYPPTQPVPTPTPWVAPTQTPTPTPPPYKPPEGCIWIGEVCYVP